MNEKLFKWVPVILTIIMALFTLASGFGSKTNEIINIKESVAAEHKTNDDQDEKIQQIQIDRAGDHQLLIDIGQDIKDIKTSIKGNHK